MPSRAEPSQGTVVCPPANPPFSLTARAEWSGVEGRGEDRLLFPLPPREANRVAVASRQGATTARACSSSAGRRAFFLSAFSALSAARGMRNLEERSSPRLSTSRLDSSRLASPRFASFRRAFLLPVRVSLSFPRKTLRSLEGKRKEDRYIIRPMVAGRALLSC